MIKVGIIGGSNPMAGELVRLLINHPDVHIKWINSARYAGRLVADVHHGLLGDTDLRFSPTADLDVIDVLFIFRHRGQTIEWLNDRLIPEDLRIIDLSVDMQDPELAAEYDFVYGLPELNRKVMVRGSRRGIVPNPVAAITSLCLMPMAKSETLDHDIDVSIKGPKDGEKTELSVDDLTSEITGALSELQPAFSMPIALTVDDDVHQRAISACVTMPTGIDIGSLHRMYEEFYTDHNFVMLTDDSQPEAREVEGTNKCLLHVDKRDGRLVVTAIMDALLKGGAGTAVHVMNLLFGLHERTGLYLKASTF